MKLGRSFFSLYFLIISIFIFFSWLLDEVWSSYIEQDIESYTGYKTMLSAVGDYLQKHPEEQWEQLLSDAAKRYELPLSLSSVSAISVLDKDDRKQLRKGKTTVYYQDDTVQLHHQLENSNQLVILGPAKMPTRPRHEAMIRVLILAVFGLMIFFWLRPISKDLDNLQSTAKKFGEGDFNQQAVYAKSETIKPMIKTFNMMANRIKRLIDAHKELSSAVAHELRTPLARSRFAVQMLNTVSDEEKKKKYINQIESDIAELDQLISEMLLYASFDSDKPKLAIKQEAIHTIIEQQVENFSQFKGSIDFIAPKEQIMVPCDSYFIGRALSNYLSNAMKYGDDKIIVSLEVSDENILVHVEDNGDGIDDDFKKRVFDAFTRADSSRNKEVTGFGLGLAIVSRIMEWHEGQVLVDNSEYGGAKFSLKWPLKLTPSA